jgi:acetyltransferase-like isoleucine patch superfamily enzyme
MRETRDFGRPTEFSEGRTLPEGVVRQFFQRCGRNVKVFQGCRIVSPDKVSLGDRSQIDEGDKIFGGLGVTIGKHVHLAFDCSIFGGGRCEIGDFSSVGSGVKIVTGSEVVTKSGLLNPTIPDHLRREPASCDRPAR